MEPDSFLPAGSRRERGKRANPRQSAAREGAICHCWGVIDAADNGHLARSCSASTAGAAVRSPSRSFQGWGVGGSVGRREIRLVRLLARASSEPHRNMLLPISASTPSYIQLHVRRSAWVHRVRRERVARACRWARGRGALRDDWPACGWCASSDTAPVGSTHAEAMGAASRTCPSRVPSPVSSDLSKSPAPTLPHQVGSSTNRGKTLAGRPPHTTPSIDHPLPPRPLPLSPTFVRVLDNLPCHHVLVGPPREHVDVVHGGCRRFV